MTSRETFITYMLVLDLWLMIVCSIRALSIHQYGPAALDAAVVLLCVFVIRAVNATVERRDQEFHEWQKTWFTKMI